MNCKSAQAVLISGILVSSVTFAKLETQSHVNSFTTLNEDLAWFQHEESVLPRSDRRGLFLKIYHSVTQEMANMFAEHQFQDPKWVTKLMLKYVSLYRNALDCDTTQNCEPAPAWQNAFAENRSGRHHEAIQLLLSISAHINRDLPVALAEIGTDFNSEKQHSDFQKISLIFNRRMPQLIAILQTYETCRLSDWDRVEINKVIQWAVGRTREESWQNGALLAAAETRLDEALVLGKIQQHTDFENSTIYFFAPLPELLVCDGVL